MAFLGCIQERIEEAKREQEDAVERECTFAPVIDARSAGMMSHRSIVLKVGSCCQEEGKPREANMHTQFPLGRTYMRQPSWSLGESLDTCRHLPFHWHRAWQYHTMKACLAVASVSKFQTSTSTPIKLLLSHTRGQRALQLWDDLQHEQS